MTASTRSLILLGPENQTAEIDILVEKSPLCVAGVWNWTENRREHGLWFIYLKRDGKGIRFGPFYAAFELASRDMNKVFKAFPKGFWDQPIEWMGRQKSFQDWVEKNIGRHEELIGGTWIKDEEK